MTEGDKAIGLVSEHENQNRDRHCYESKVNTVIFPGAISYLKSKD